MSKAVITSNPKILGGKPVIAGTRIAVETIMDMLASGMSTKKIIDEYPVLTTTQIRAAIEFAASKVKRDIVLPIETKGKEIIFHIA